MTTRLHAGTSGWRYTHWCGPFYPGQLPVARRLEHCVRFFDMVELNNSFYRLPQCRPSKPGAGKRRQVISSRSKRNAS